MALSDQHRHILNELSRSLPGLRRNQLKDPIDLGDTFQAVDNAVAAAEAAQAAAEAAQAAAEAAQGGAETAEANAVAAVADIAAFSTTISLGQSTRTVTHTGLGGKPVWGAILGTPDLTLSHLLGFSWSGDNLTIHGVAVATGTITVRYWIDSR